MLTVSEGALHLTPGKPNAVRAAFKAGIKPSQIARQFGLSQSDVRKALASDASRRAPDGDYVARGRPRIHLVEFSAFRIRARKDASATF
jgi:hypothetical protein